MKKLNTFLLIAFLLSSCAPAATAIPTSALQPILPTLTLTPEPIATQTLSPTETLIPTPTQIGGRKGKLIFDYFSREYNKNYPEVTGDSNIFIASSDGSELKPVTNMEGYNFLKDVSPDGTKALFVSTDSWNATTADLYSVDIASNSQPVKLAKGLPYSYNFYKSAIWLDNMKLIYVGQGKKGLGIYIINADGTNPVNVEFGNNPVEILGIGHESVFWKTNKTAGHVTSPAWWTNLDGTKTGKLTYNNRQINSYNLYENDITPSPDGTRLAWVDAGTPESGHTENWLRIANIDDIDHPFISVELITSGSDLKWQRDGKSLIVFDEGSVNWGFGKGSNNYGYFEVSAESGVVTRNYQLSDEVMGAGNDYTPLQCGDISPDDKLLPCLVFASDKDKTAEGFLPAQLNFLNFETGTITKTTDLVFYFGGQSRKIAWIP